LKRRAALAVVTLALGALAGCVSVPLSTIVRMSTFDEQDFAALDPGVIRARIKLADGYALDPSRSWLGVQVASAAGVHEGEFRLEQVTQMRAPLAQGLFAGDATGTEYTLRLSDASAQEFRKLQAFVRQGQPGEVVIRVVPILSAFPDEAASAPVWIDLLLSREDGYFTLVDAAQVPMAAIREASAEGR